MPRFVQLNEGHHGYPRKKYFTITQLPLPRISMWCLQNSGQYSYMKISLITLKAALIFHLNMKNQDYL